MEDLYSNLENYQDENVISELRHENQELKCKLEEYASNLAKLQIDFDKLSTEYKKLELNYSSLLKTARAEIERKSQLITNLNIEKDKLVINYFQTQRRPQYQKGNDNNYQISSQLPKEAGSRKERNGAVVSNSNDNVFVTLNCERNDETDKNSIEVIKIERNSKKLDHYRDKEKHGDNNKKVDKRKEIPIEDDLNNATVACKVSKIRNRRKSMPLLKRGDCKFSSDEDQDPDPRDYCFRRKTPLRDDRTDNDKVYLDKHRNGRNDTERKVTEITRIADKRSSIYDSSRNRKGISRYRERIRHKSRDNRDRYEPTQRSRKHYSPERSHFNIQGEYYNKYRETNDRLCRSDNVRQRTLVSPPPEKYHQHRGSREFEGQRFQHESVNPFKHKTQDVIEEPASKRFRSDSLNKQSDNRMFVQNRDVDGHANSVSRPLELSYFSLQSPDYVNFENNATVDQIKEIKGSADTKLDDPRLTSKKYTVSTHRDKIILSTVTGKNVDIKTIDATIWNKDNDQEIHKMPTPLREKPQNSNNLVKDIYMGIDDPISNLSLESGEICVEDEFAVSEIKDTVKTDTVKGNSAITCVSDKVRSQKQIQINKIAADDTEESIQKNCSTAFSQNYRIPKVKKSSTPKPLEDDVSYNTRNKVNKRDHTDKGGKNKKNREKRHDDLDTKIQPEVNNYKASKSFSGNIDIGKNESHKFVDTNARKSSPQKRIISVKDTVEGDLELSDETCDYLEVSDQTGHGNVNNAQEVEECNKNLVIDGINKDFKIRELTNPDYICTDRAVFENGMETLCEKKHFNVAHEGHDNVQPKESFSKTYNEHKSKDIKSKLCDLFGDTSSLITLDDLGVVPSTTTKDLNVYTPLFENTQDAVDFNVEEMEKVQTQSMKSKRDDEPILNCGPHEVTSNKNKGSKTSSKKEKSKCNIDKSSSSQQILVNVNTETEENNVIKTVIISSGIQNNCHSADVIDDENREKPVITNTVNNATDNATSCPALSSLQALATSTPHKPQIEIPLIVPEISCNSSNSATTKDASNISSNTEEISKLSRKDLDVPDVRIIVKRRRKAKGAP